MRFLFIRTQLLLAFVFFTVFSFAQSSTASIMFDNNQTEYYGCGNGVILVNNVFPQNFGNGPYTYVWEQKLMVGSSWSQLQTTFTNQCNTGAVAMPTEYRLTIYNSSNQSVTSNIIRYYLIYPPTPPTIGPSSQTVIFGTGAAPQSFTSLAATSNTYPMYSNIWQISNDGVNWSFTNGEGLFSTDPISSAPINTQPGLFSYGRAPYEYEIGTKYFRVRVQPASGFAPNVCLNDGSLAAYSNVVTLNINYAPIVAGNAIFQNGQSSFTGCGINVQLFTNSSASGGKPPYTFRWERKTQSSNTWIAIPNSNSESLLTGVITEPMNYRRITIDSRGVEAASGIANYNLLANPTPPILTPTSQVIAIGSGSTFQNIVTQTPASGYPQFTSFWESANSASGPWDFLNGDQFFNTTGSINPAAPVLTANSTQPTQTYTKYYRARVSPAINLPVGCENIVVGYSAPILVSAVNPVAINGGNVATLNNATSFCISSTPPLLIETNLPSGGYGTLTSIWQERVLPSGNFTDIANSSGSNYQPPAFTGSKSFRRKTTDQLGTIGYSNEFTITANDCSTPLAGGTIRTLDNVYGFCNGDLPSELIVWDPATGGSGTLTGSWQEKILPSGNWTNIANSSALNYQPPTFVGSRMFRRRTIDANSNIAYSNEVTIHSGDCSVPLVGGTIQYSGSSNTICSNSTVQQFTNSTSATGIGTITYIWQYRPASGLSWINFSNSNSTNFLPTEVFTETFTIRRRAADQAGRFAFSNQIVITVGSNNLDGGNVVYTDFICFNTSLAPIQNTRNAQGGTGTLLYTWEKLIDGVWTAFTTPSGTALSLSNTSANTTVSPTTGSFRRKVTDQCGNVAYSNTCIVSSQFVSAGSIQIANNTINAGQTPNVILSGFRPSAGQPQDYGPNSPLVLSWVSSTNINGPWVVIPNATSEGYQSGPLFQTTYFRRVSTETICNKRDTSNVLTINVTGFLNPGSISSTQHNTTICIGTALNNIANVTAATSSSNSITYEWQYINSSVGVWTSIINSNSLSYTPQPITINTRFRRKATDGNNLVVYSNEIVINVNTVTPTLQITNGTNVTTTCSGVLTLTTNASNITSYQWQKLDNGVYVNINGADLSSYNIIEPGTYRVVGTSSCGSTQIISNSCTVAITNYGLTPSLSISTNSFLTGSCQDVGFFTSTGVALNNERQWQRLINGVFINISGETRISYKAQESGTYRVISTTSCNGVPIVSNEITVNIIPSGDPNEFGNGIWRFYGFDGTNANMNQNTYKGFYDNDVATNPNNFYTQDHWNTFFTPSTLAQNTPFTTDWYGCNLNNPNNLTVIAKRRGFDCGNYNLWVRVSSGDRLKLVVDGRVITETYSSISFSNEYLSAPISLNANSTIEVWTSSSTAGTFISFEARRIGGTNLVGGTITPSTQTLSLGATPVLLANATNPTGGNGSTYLYQWEQSNQFIGPYTEIANATNNSLQLGALYQTTYYRRKTYQTGCSYGAYSNVATITLPPIVPITGGTISLNGATTSLCSGDIPSLISNTSNPTNGSGVYTYTWQKNVSNTGWVDIAGSNSLNYQPLAINAATSFRRKVVDNLNNTAYSNEISITVTNCYVQLSGGTIAYENGDVTLCPRTPLGRINNVTNASGGNLPRSYQWQQKPANSNTWYSITYAYDSTYTPAPLTTTTSFRRMVVDEDGTIAYSNVITITIATTGLPLNGGTVVAQNFTCDNTTTNIPSLINPSGGSTNYGYSLVWEQLQNNRWVEITAPTANVSNLTNAILIRPLANNTGSFRRKVTDFCGNIAYSNQGTAATIANQFIFAGTIATNNNTILPGETPSIIVNHVSPDAGLATTSGTLQISWQQTTDLNGSWAAIQSANNLSYQPTALTQTTHYRRVVRETLCGSVAISNIITLQVSNIPTSLFGGIIQTSTNCLPIHSATVISHTGSPNLGGTMPYIFEWQKNENGNWVSIANSNDLNLALTNLTTSTSFRRKVKDANNDSTYSNIIKLNIQNAPLKAGIIGKNYLLCNSDPSAYLYEIISACDGGGNLQYQWEYSLGNNTWQVIPNSNTPNYTFTNMNTDVKVRRKVFDDCGNSAVSNTVEVFIHPQIIAGILAPSNQTVCSNGTTLPTTISLINNNHYTNGTVAYQWQQSTSANGTFTDISGASRGFFTPTIVNTTMYYRLKVTSNICNYVSFTNAVTVTSNNCP